MVEVTQSTIVTPSDQTPKHKIYLSNLDIVADRSYTPTFYVYPSSGMKDLFPIEVFKAALAKALVVFYPLSGRLSRDPQTGRPEIDCTGEGVNFLTEDLDATVEDFKDFKPSAEMRKMLVPVVNSADPPCIIMAIQMTRLRCGDIIIGFANHHYIIDGHSAVLFIKTLSAFARGNKSTIPTPFFDHSLLPKSLPIQRSVKHLLSVLALLWKCTCIARGLASDVETQLIIPVDLRNRFKPPLPETYFGNPTLRTNAVAKVEDLVSNMLKFGSNLIQNAVNSITDEFGRSLIDHLEITELESLGKLSSMSTSLMAVSWLSFPMYDADFGWGEPILMARAEMYGSGYVYLSRVPEMDDGISILIGLERDSMQCFKKTLYDEIEAARP
ncbi:putrescine hydroxycinnamoyltransferase 1-like [Carex rostrata]